MIEESRTRVSSENHTGAESEQPIQRRLAEGRRDRIVALWCGTFALAMLGAAFAAVPLYQLYCQATGYGGTTQRAEGPATSILERTITVRFDANVRDMPWVFEPVQNTLDVRIGETALVFFRATNTSDKPVRGTAMFNVTPEITGLFFKKIACFCFQEQTLAPGETVEMPVTFYVDPAIVLDPDARKVGTITLSYTFFPMLGATKPVAQDTEKAAKPVGG